MARGGYGDDEDLGADRRRALRERREQILLDMELAQIERLRWRSAAIPTGWEQVDRDNPTRPRRVMISLRLDADVAKWFRAQGQGYQARVNAVLRAFMAFKAAGKAEPAHDPF